MLRQYILLPFAFALIMPSHQETQHLPYTTRQIFDLVADVARYPEFIPWCVGARVYDKADNAFTADLLIGYKQLREKYTSRVTLSPPDTEHGSCNIEVELIRGPFHHLENHWTFTPNGNGTDIQFHLDFQFRTKMLEKLIGGFFFLATQKMVGAFQSRAEELYE